MAILGEFLTPLPVFFDAVHVLSEMVTEIFPMDTENVIFYFAFSPRCRYKTPRAAYIKSARKFRVATSSRVKQFMALACRRSQDVCGGDTR